MTLASKRKMSQRHKTSRSSQSTQTELSSSTSSWSLLDAATINGITAEHLSCYGNVDMPQSPVHVPPHFSSMQPSTTATATTGTTAASQQLNGEFYEDAAAMFDKLVKAEEVSPLVSGGARTSKQPGHFQTTKVVRQVIWCEATKPQMAKNEANEDQKQARD